MWLKKFLDKINLKRYLEKQSWYLKVVDYFEDSVLGGLVILPLLQFLFILLSITFIVMFVLVGIFFGLMLAWLLIDSLHKGLI
jgi:hypothetical protein